MSEISRISKPKRTSGLSEPLLIHCILPGHARQRQLDVNIQHFLEHALEEALVDGDNVILLNERHPGSIWVNSG